MSTAYNRHLFGSGTMPMRGQSYQHNAPTPEREEPVYRRDIGLYLEGIGRGKTVSLKMTIYQGMKSGNLFPESFVFSGSRDLWLLAASAVDSFTLIGDALPLDTFCAGAPHQVSWPMLDCVNGARLEMVIENRGRARNDGTGTFIGRLTCLVKNEARHFAY